MVSIITATYNSANTIEDCINSVNNQTYENIEHIVIDGLSSDSTIEIVRNKSKRVTQVISEKDHGIYDAMNKGISNSQGDIIGILNSDDLYYDSKVIEKVRALFQDKSIDCVHGDLYYVANDNTSNVIRYWKTGEKNSFVKGWHPAHPTFFVRKCVYEKYGIFNLKYKLAADFELMLRFIEKHKVKLHYLEEPIVRMRLGGATNKNIKNIIRGNIECFKAFKENELPVSILYPIYRLAPKLKQFFIHE